MGFPRSQCGLPGGPHVGQPTNFTFWAKEWGSCGLDPGLSGLVLFPSLPLDVIIKSTSDLISYEHFLVFITMRYKFTITLDPLKMKQFSQ